MIQVLDSIPWVRCASGNVLSFVLTNHDFNLRNKWAQTEASAGELINSNLLKAAAGIHLLSFNILQPLLVN